MTSSFDPKVWYLAQISRINPGSQKYSTTLCEYNYVCVFGEGNGNKFQHSCLENPVDRGAWGAVVHRVAQSRTRLKRLSMHACIGEGDGSPLQCSCLGESQGQQSLVGCCLWGRTESVTTEATQQSSTEVYGAFY